MEVRNWILIADKMSSLEQELAKSLSVSTSQLRFTLCLFGAIPISWVQRQIRSVETAHFFAFVSGLLMVYLPFGTEVFHLLPPVIVTFCALKLAPGRCARIVWGLCFPYVIALHFLNASGMAWQDGAMDATGAQMILFLKLVSLAQCHQNAIHVKDPNVKWTNYEKEHLVVESPTLLEFLSYLFCFGNLLSGPFVEFSEYKQYVERRGVWKEELPSRWGVFFIRFFKMCGTLILLVSIGLKYQHPLLFTESYNESNLVEKFLTVSLVSGCYRLRYYFAWSTSEVASIASGFGFQGSRDDQQHKWDRCKNVDILKTEMPSSFATIPHNWNICTGRFLRRYVYDRLTPTNGRPTFYTLLLTQIISGLWHGLYPGYFLFFVSATVAIAASKVVHKWEQSTSLSQHGVYKVVRCIYSILSLSYTSSAFIVLSFHDSIQVYRSMLFLPHLSFIGILLLGVIIPPNKHKTQ